MYNNNIAKFTDYLCIFRMQLLQKKSECQSVMLVFDTTDLPDYNGPGYWPSRRDPVNPSIKYQIMLSFPRVCKCL